MRSMGRSLFKFLILILLNFSALNLILSCQSQKEEKHIMARIGDRVITSNEFIMRAEYTPRPVYCRDENYIHRKIALNSLITEKLLALEAGENNELTRNEEFRLYMQGRREQAMRQWFYQKDIIDNVKHDSSEINKYYAMAGRAYRVSFINCPNKESAASIKDEMTVMGRSFEQVCYSLTGDTALPEREIKFDTEQDQFIIDALYGQAVQKNQIIGPLEAGNGQYLLARVDGWTTHVAISEKQQTERLQSVKEKLTDFGAQKIFREYTLKLMEGKRLDFERDTFEELVNAIGPEYFKTEAEKREAFNKKFWNKDNEEMTLDDLPEKMSRLRDKKLLTIDGQIWTVADFEQAIQIHPLVFRNRKMPKNKFGEQFKLAVADLIRDQYITKDAYARGYDKVNFVQRDLNMWRDNLLALYQKKLYMDSIDVQGKDQYSIVKDVLDPYAAKLREKYSDRVEINTDEFEQTRLTRIDMFVIQKNAPFAVIVPGFPQVTTHNKLDYGRKMETPGAKQNAPSEP